MTLGYGLTSFGEGFKHSMASLFICISISPRSIAWFDFASLLACIVGLDFALLWNHPLFLHWHLSIVRDANSHPHTYVNTLTKRDLGKNILLKCITSFLH